MWSQCGWQWQWQWHLPKLNGVWNQPRVPSHVFNTLHQWEKTLSLCLTIFKLSLAPNYPFLSFFLFPICFLFSHKDTFILSHLFPKPFVKEYFFFHHRFNLVRRLLLYKNMKLNNYIYSSMHAYFILVPTIV
jgi:hypothetical protein